MTVQQPQGARTFNAEVPEIKIQQDFNAVYVFALP